MLTDERGSGLLLPGGRISQQRDTVRFDRLIFRSASRGVRHTSGESNVWMLYM